MTTVMKITKHGLTVVEPEMPFRSYSSVTQHEIENDIVDDTTWIKIK